MCAAWTSCATTSGWHVLGGQPADPVGNGLRDAEPAAHGARDRRDDVTGAEYSRSTARPSSCGETLEAAAPEHAADAGPSVALLSTGPTDPAWFEHRMLAEEMGIPLVHSTDLIVTDGEVGLHRDGARTPVDVLYLRIDEETLLHPRAATADRSGPTCSKPSTAEPSRWPTHPGTASETTKPSTPTSAPSWSTTSARSPLLADVPTYLCGKPDHLTDVLPRLADLVMKPVDGYGGQGVVIGPDATEEQLAAIERQAANCARTGGSLKSSSTCRPCRRSTAPRSYPATSTCARSC